MVFISLITFHKELHHGCLLQYISTAATSTFHPKPFIEASASYLARVNMNGLVGVNALVLVAVALAMTISKAAALGQGVGSGGIGFPGPSGGSGGFTIGKK
ncbi:hypothetical protein MTO96_030656 [Rhipicephalus appendiculatus]